MQKYMTGAVSVPNVNMRECCSTRFDGIVDSGKQLEQQFAGFVTSITEIAGKWHE